MNNGALQVLFIEDSDVDVELTVIELERDGFRVSWDQVDTEPALRDILESASPEVVISDYSMPSFDGITALRVVREMKPSLPFIFLSGTIGEERAIESIREGATDYVLKSNMRRLPTAVRRALTEAEERVRARQAEKDRERLAAILEATSDCVAICDPEGGLIYLNAAGQNLTGLDGRGLDGINVAALHPEMSRTLVFEEGWPAAIRDGLWHGETTMLAVDGSEIPMSQLLIAHRRNGGEIEHFSMIARDIRDRKAYEERIAFLANYDALTELPNRSLLSDRATQAMSYGRYSDRSLALLVIDIDRFKMVNDGYGQSTGDRALKMVGERLLETVREGDTVARLGADSFAILATDLAHPDDILTVVRKVQSSIREPFILNERQLHLTVSVGASMYPRDGTDLETLLRNADAAMHRVKTEGQDSFQFYAANMTREAADRVDLENDLRGALDRGELALHYQPQINLDTGNVFGVEALMRWNHPERGWVSPGVFIPIAEHADFINTLGEWALQEACAQLKRWTEKGYDLRMAVNVSARQFRFEEFARTVDRTIAETGVEAGRLELELTESVLIEDQAMAATTLEELNSVGVTVAIDDFGTGYSSLGYLSRLPINCLKIDRTFLQRIPGKQHDTAIVQGIISLAESLGVDVLAEGVETVEQLTFLREHRCNQAQGFYFSKPVSAEQIEDSLSKGATSWSHQSRDDNIED